MSSTFLQNIDLVKYYNFLYLPNSPLAYQNFSQNQFFFKLNLQTWKKMANFSKFVNVALMGAYERKKKTILKHLFFQKQNKLYIELVRYFAYGFSYVASSLASRSQKWLKSRKQERITAH